MKTAIRRALPLLALSVVLLPSCAVVNPTAERAAALPEAERAYVIGEFRVGCRPGRVRCSIPWNSVNAFFQNLDGPGGGFFGVQEGGILGGNTDYDFVQPEASVKGIYFCMPLPPGRFALTSYRYWNFAGGGSGFTLQKEHHFRVPFELGSGELVDIGRIKLTTGTRENMFGVDLPAPGKVLLSSSAEAEVAAAVAKCPAGVQSWPIRHGPLDADVANHPLVGKEVTR